MLKSDGLIPGCGCNLARCGTMVVARTRYASDRGLSRRMITTMGGLGLLYVLVVVVLIAVGLNAIFVSPSSPAACCFAQWYFSDTMALCDR